MWKLLQIHKVSWFPVDERRSNKGEIHENRPGTWKWKCSVRSDSISCRQNRRRKTEDWGMVSVNLTFYYFTVKVCEPLLSLWRKEMFKWSQQVWLICGHKVMTGWKKSTKNLRQPTKTSKDVKKTECWLDLSCFVQNNSNFKPALWGHLGQTHNFKERVCLWTRHFVWLPVLGLCESWTNLFPASCSLSSQSVFLFFLSDWLTSTRWVFVWRKRRTEQSLSCPAVCPWRVTGPK